MGNNFKSSGIPALDIADFANGVKAVYENAKPEMTYDEAKQIINEFFTRMQQEITEKNREIGEKFLEENKKRAGVVTLPSGLQYEVITEGKGDKPRITDKVKCHYEGTLVNGQVFDSSIKRGEPAVFGVNQVIAGWVEALQLMPVGSKWKLYIPAALAYGERGAGDIIGPDSTLIFEIELIDIIK